VAILVGFKTRWIAWAFVAWLIVVTYVAHPFWTMDGQPRGLNMVNFYKNLAIIGGYLLLATAGGGRYSADGQMTKREPCFARPARFREVGRVRISSAGRPGRKCGAM